MFDLFTVFAMRGNSVLGFLFMPANARDSELAFGVVLRANNVRCGSSEQRLPFSMYFSLFVLSFLQVHCF